MSREKIKEDIQNYLNHQNVKAISANFFKKKYPEADIQSIFDEMVIDGEVGVSVTYQCANCLQRDPRMYATEIWDDVLIYFMCLQCDSEYENEECVHIDEITYYKNINK